MKESHKCPRCGVECLCPQDENYCWHECEGAPTPDAGEPIDPAKLSDICHFGQCEAGLPCGKKGCPCPCHLPADAGEQEAQLPILQSEIDEKLMRETLLKCYSSDQHIQGFRVSVEHYRYLAEQIVSLRRHIAAPQAAVPLLCEQCKLGDHSIHDVSIYRLGCQNDHCHCTVENHKISLPESQAQPTAQELPPLDKQYWDEVSQDVIERNPELRCRERQLRAALVRIAQLEARLAAVRAELESERESSREWEKFYNETEELLAEATKKIAQLEEALQQTMRN